MKIGFIDYSHEERNRILSTLKMLGDQTALDELGIGVVRDAYADILFPGISTLQTRAKYLVLVPYLFQSAKAQAEKGKIRSGRELLQWINEAEDRLAATLTNNCPPSEVGIVGSNAYGKTGANLLLAKRGPFTRPGACHRYSELNAERSCEPKIAHAGKNYAEYRFIPPGRRLVLGL